MKTLFFLISTSIVLASCSKNDSQPAIIDYSQYKLKTSVHSRRSYTTTSSEFSSDTSTYTYSGITLNYTTRYSTGRVSDNSITLNNGLYTQDLVVDGTPSPTKTYYKLNASGHIDTSWITNNTATTQTSKYNYNGDGTRAMEIHDYSSYKNINRYYYQNGAASYSLNERISNSPSVPNGNDSVVYEYAYDLPFRADYYNSGLPTFLFGKPANNLLKKTTRYNKLNNNSVTQTTEYAYQTNSMGLITRRIFNLYTQPGNVLVFADTTVYTYYNK